MLQMSEHYPPSSEESYIASTIAPMKGLSPNVMSSPKRSLANELEKEPRKGKWHVNAMGQVIFKDHNGYTLMKQIQMGVRTTVSQIMPKKNRELRLSDVKYVLKLDFPNKGSLQTPPHKYPHFVFYDYAPMAFRHLRERFGIDASHFLISLCHDKSLSILGTPGKSGALFFFSADMQYIIKTITKAESKFLRKILPQYYNHVMANPSTLITRFYGLYSIKPTDGRNVRFIIMNNFFDTKLYVEERYDLKGSTIGRNASEKEKQRETPILKDNDFLERKRKIHLSAKMKKKIMDQLKNDCSWLEKMKIMDYSLLLGAHKVSEEDCEIFSPSSTALLLNHSAEANADQNFEKIIKKCIQIEPLMEQPVELRIEALTESAIMPPSTCVMVDTTEQTVVTAQSDITITVTQTQTETANSNYVLTPESVTSKVDFSGAGSSVSNTSSPPRKSSFFQLFRTHDNMLLEKQFQGEKVSEFQRFYGGVLSEKLDSAGTREIYFIGIIDLLQQWNNRKQLENIFKGFTNDKKKISAVSPKLYASRFIKFIEDIIIVD